MVFWINEAQKIALVSLTNCSNFEKASNLLCKIEQLQNSEFSWKKFKNLSTEELKDFFLIFCEDDPVKRFFSTYKALTELSSNNNKKITDKITENQKNLFSAIANHFKKPFHEVNKLQLICYINNYGCSDVLMLKPQSQFYPRSHERFILLRDKYFNEDIVESLQLIYPTFKQEWKSWLPPNPLRKEMFPKLINEIKQLYAEDYEFAANPIINRLITDCEIVDVRSEHVLCKIKTSKELQNGIYRINLTANEEKHIVMAVCSNSTDLEFNLPPCSLFKTLSFNIDGFPFAEQRLLPKILFIHIPKTAGTSLKSQLASQYKSDDLLPTLNQAKKDERCYAEVSFIHDTSPDILKNKRLIIGHYPLCVENYIDRKPFKIVILRSPEERVKSLINHMVSVQNMGVDEIFQTQKAQLHNFMVRVLSSNENNFNRDLLDATDLELAKKKLREFHFVGFTESYKDDLAKLANSLHMTFKHRIENTISGKVNFTHNQIEVIRALNTLDLMLYKYAWEVFKN